MTHTNRFSFIIGSIFLGVLALAIVAGAYLLRDSGALKQRVTIHVQFSDIAGLRPGSPVRLEGRDIGTVTSIDTDQSGARHLATLSIVDTPANRKWIRPDSRFQVLSDNLLGNKLVEISWGTTGAPLADGSTVIGEHPVSIEGILKDLRRTVRSTAGVAERLDKALKILDRDGGDGLAQSITQLQQSLADMSAVTGELRLLFEKDSRDPQSLRATLADLRKASGNAAALMEELKAGLRSPDGKQRKLGEILTNLEKTAANSSEVTESVKKMLGGRQGSKPVDLQKTLQDLEVSAKNLKDITESTKSMMGTLRKMYPPNWFK